jgi:hypothetical protein
MASTARRTLLRIGMTTVAYTAGSALVTGGMAFASQPKRADMTGVVRFPRYAQRTRPRPAAFASRYDEAVFHIRNLRAERNGSNPAFRRYHMAQIKLDWWQGELARIVAGRSTAQEGI